VDFADHRRQLGSDRKIANRVIVIVHQRANINIKMMFRRVAIELPPEDFFRRFGFEGLEFVGAPDRQEINAVIAIPMLKPVVAIEELIPRDRPLAHET
jgi:hypothetical protein